MSMEIEKQYSSKGKHWSFHVGAWMRDSVAINTEKNGSGSVYLPIADIKQFAADLLEFVAAVNADRA